MKPQSKRDGVVWISPPYGWVKENFDGSPKGNLGKAGCGMCLRSHLRDVLAFKCLSLPSSTNDMVEAFGLLYGLVLAKNLDLKAIHIEGNSTLIINAYIKRQILNWRIRYIMIKIWNLIDSFEIYHISHIYKEGNATTDLLAE